MTRNCYFIVVVQGFGVFEGINARGSEIEDTCIFGGGAPRETIPWTKGRKVIAGSTHDSSYLFIQCQQGFGPYFLGRARRPV